MELKATIIDPVGLHARPASTLVNAIAKFESDIIIKTAEGKEANAKSIMTVMSLGIANGDEITFSATGSDEAEAIATIEKVLKEEKII
jgi:phosphocarrier protein